MRQVDFGFRGAKNIRSRYQPTRVSCTVIFRSNDLGTKSFMFYQPVRCIHIRMHKNKKIQQVNRDNAMRVLAGSLDHMSHDLSKITIKFTDNKKAGALAIILKDKNGIFNGIVGSRAVLDRIRAFLRCMQRCWPVMISENFNYPYILGVV